MTEGFPKEYFGAPQPHATLTKQDLKHARTTFKRHLIAFVEQLPPHARVLDVGCGSGKALRLIRALRPDVHLEGLDMTDMRAFLPDDVSFTQGSVDDMVSLYKADSFDAIVCQHVVEHLLYPVPLMNGMRHVLKPGGKAYIETPNWTRLVLPFSHLWFWSDYTHVRPASRFSMWRLLTEHELVPERIVTVSSCVWLPRKPGRSEAAPKSRRAPSGPAVAPHSLVARVVARLVNPLARDVLIGIARKP